MNQTQQDHVNAINETSGNMKRGFFIIAEHMAAIKEGWDGKQSEADKFITEHTGYKKSAISGFMRAHRTMLNLTEQGNSTPCGNFILPNTEGQMRPLTRLDLLKNAELQWSVWSKAVELSGGNQPSSKVIAEARILVDADWAEFKRMDAENKRMEAEIKDHKDATQKVVLEKVLAENARLKAEIETLKSSSKAELLKQLHQAQRELNTWKLLGKGGSSAPSLSDEDKATFKRMANHYAKTVHPDHGGSHDEMIRVNALKTAFAKA